QCYPIRSDEKKGEGQFGSKEIEFDIIHVCRKRLTNHIDECISWAKLRGLIIDDVQRVTKLLEIHHAEGLPEADMLIIKRGKALEYYSRHYGLVINAAGQIMDIPEVLTEINRIIDNQSDSDNSLNTCDFLVRLFLTLFKGRNSLPADQMQKSLRSTSIDGSEFTNKKWCQLKSKEKEYVLTNPNEFYKLATQDKRKKEYCMSGKNELDQALFLIGICAEDTNINTVLKPTIFTPHPATKNVIEWFTKNAEDTKVRESANTAKILYVKYLQEHPLVAPDSQAGYDKMLF
ncbi:MAG: hypothetical protein LBH59_07390, partial [Planctomycetaceae bacterium]|nr:hypothetical protein [Planctomycetaceae bacterium]